MIVQSGFSQTPYESFHTMQDGWKLEIEEVLHDLRNKESVSTTVYFFLLIHKAPL